MTSGPDLARSPAVPGDVLFARYAFPPNELGYCGPDDPDVLLRHATSAAVMGSGAAGREEIRRRARQFDGAWVYLELIAAAAGIPDPLDARVVEAYWVGNRLLDDVESQVLVATLGKRFAGQLVGAAGRRWNAMPASSGLAHHSFHVFAVYPWIGLLVPQAPGGRVDVALTVLEQCRIRWGTVTARHGDRLHVRTRPLTWDGRQLCLGPEHTESVRWTSAGHERPDVPEPGELVSCHWDWVCDRLTEAQLAELATRTAHQLELVPRSRV